MGNLLISKSSCSNGLFGALQRKSAGCSLGWDIDLLQSWLVAVWCADSKNVNFIVLLQLLLIRENKNSIWSIQACHGTSMFPLLTQSVSVSQKVRVLCGPQIIERELSFCSIYWGGCPAALQGSRSAPLHDLGTTEDPNFLGNNFPVSILESYINFDLTVSYIFAISEYRLFRAILTYVRRDRLMDRLKAGMIKKKLFDQSVFSGSSHFWSITN